MIITSLRIKSLYLSLKSSMQSKVCEVKYVNVETDVIPRISFKNLIWY